MNIDICPHGFLRIECQICREMIKSKTPVSIGENPRNWEFEVPYTRLNLDFKEALSKRLKPVHILESQKRLTGPSIFSKDMHSETKSLIEQRNELLTRIAPGQKELDEITKIVDIKKKFLKKKEL